MEIKNKLLKAMSFILLIPLIVIAYYGVPYYWEKRGVRIQQEKIEEEKARDVRRLVRKKEVKKPQAYLMTHGIGFPESTKEVMAQNGEWTEPIEVESNQYLWVEFLNKNIPDDKVYLKCSHYKKGVRKAKVADLVSINDYKQDISDLTSCRWFSAMIPPNSKTRSATVVWSMTTMR